MAAGSRFDHPTLGWMLTRWVAAHCVIPDGFRRGEPFEAGTWQGLLYLNHYRVKPTAKWRPEQPMLAAAFHYRRSQVVRPQKAGKNPAVASLVCAEGVGPVLFRDWANGGEVYDCADHGCGCGWGYEYELGEPIGMAWPTPLIQITAYSEEATDNTYDALRPMIEAGPLRHLIPKTGEEFIRLPRGGRIDVVTSNARSRLGQRVTFVPQDETGIWTKASGMIGLAETQRRGLAGMGGRAVETTNAWDPAEHSVAQRTAESKARDIYRDHPLPPAELSYKNKRHRARIHRCVYAGSPWVDLEDIEREAAELLETDPAQAERFYGNRVVSGHDAAFAAKLWASCAEPQAVERRARVTLGFDGARFDDTTGLVATHLETGYQWVAGLWLPADGEVDSAEVDADVRQTFADYDVVRFYGDPPYWETHIDAWAGDFGTDVVKAWWTNRRRAMALAIRAYHTALVAREVTHSADPVFAEHVGNARKVVHSQLRDDEGAALWTIHKDRPGSPNKIDLAVCAVLSWEARGDAIAKGALNVPDSEFYAF